MVSTLGSPVHPGQSGKSVLCCFPPPGPVQTAELGCLGCSLQGFPACHFAAEQMDGSQAPFFSHSSGENESRQVLPTPSYQVAHPSQTGATDRAQAHLSAPH